MKPIPDYPGYFATKDGRIYSEKRQMFLKQRKIGSSLVVDLSVKGISYTKTVGVLVYAAFTGGYPNVVAHRDENFINNSIENLYASTVSEVNQKNNAKKDYTCRTINKINLQTGHLERITLKPKENIHEYYGANNCIKYRTLTYKGHCYFLDGKKQELINRIKFKIKRMQRIVNNEYQYTELMTTTAFKNRIKKHQEILKVLEGINDIYN